MTFNASYLCVRSLRLHVHATQLWDARYVDETGKNHPMCLGALIQHLLLTHPRIVCFCSTLLLLDLLLLGYLLFHFFLVLTNQTTYERYCRSEHSSEKLSSRGFYNLGARRNIVAFWVGCNPPSKVTRSPFKPATRILNDKRT
uniref:Putative palmitoyltransferase ZDHHC4 n=2 Tax=Schistocephalus solidus TaxID=70667 RepID=A0A0X3P3Y6_SCHSO